MKNIMTFESYISYADYAKSKSRFGTPTDIEEDLRITLRNMLNFSNILDQLDIELEDQSTDKGIKWEATLSGKKGKDTIHAYKNNPFRGKYEFYLNKKKTSEKDIQNYFINKYVSDLDSYMSSVKAYDKNYIYSDDGSAYRKGEAQRDNLIAMYAALSDSDKRKAADFYSKHYGEKIDPTKFKGA
jgi:hypothetical protein